MQRLKSPGFWVVALIVGSLLVGGVWLWRLARIDDEAPFLSRIEGAEWITYPTPVAAQRRPGIQLDAEFERDFRLTAAPGGARLRLCALRRAEVTLNGQAVLRTDGDSWKAVTEIDVSDKLHLGSNRLRVTVASGRTMPSLWLALEVDGVTVTTDAEWRVSLAGAAWRQAVLCEERMVAGSDTMISPSNLAAPPTTGDALARGWVDLVIFGGLAALIVLGFDTWHRRRRTRTPGSEDVWTAGHLKATLAVVIVLWVILFLNNVPQIDPNQGFDREGHLQYIGIIADEGRLPLAEDGWQTYQPPLYYMLSSLLVWAGGVAPATIAGTEVLRVTSMVIGVMHVALIFGCLRLLFPGDTGKQLAGLIFAAMLPMHLYMHHYVTNETLAALLATASIYCALRVLREETPGWRWPILLGVSMGAGLLTKFTVVVVVPVVLVVLAGRLVALRDFSWRPWLRRVAVPAAVCLAVCGWHYVRVWSHYGTPVVGNWDAPGTPPWWQDPGIHMTSYYTSFGRSLVQPIMSGFHSFGDSLYSTLWGDGFCGGGTAVADGPPWNDTLRLLGYLLAVPMMVAVVVGFAAAVVRLVRHREPAWFIVLGVAFVTLLGLTVMTLKLPFYGQAKAFYGMAASACLVTFFVVGFDALTRHGKVLRHVGWVLLLVWAMNAWTSHWIRGGDADVHTTYGEYLVSVGQIAEGKERFNRAVALDANDPEPRYHLGVEHIAHAQSIDANDPDSERRRVRLREFSLGEADLQAVLAIAPDHVLARLNMVALRVVALRLAQDKTDDALAEVDRIIALAPDEVQGHGFRALIMEHRGRHDEAIRSMRDVLRITPGDPSRHKQLAQLYDKTGDLVRARRHRAIADRWSAVTSPAAE